MSKVTVGELTQDLIPFTEKGDKIINVEIVPRKIVENIIVYCKMRSDKAFDDSSLIDIGKRYAFDDVIAYAENQLKMFEEDR